MNIETLKSLWQRFLSDEDGLSATEYAILFVVLVALIAGAAATLGGAINGLFVDGTNAVNGVGPAAP